MTSSSIELIAPSDRSGSWQFLLDAIERLSLARSMEDVVQVVRDHARIVAGADGVCFVLREGDRCHYVEENAIGPLWKGRKFPMSACISGWAMLNRATAVVPDIYADPRIPHDAYRPTFVQSLVMVPVRRQDPLGAIGTYWSFRHTPDEDRILRIESLARATATALENVGLYASLQAELDHAREQAAQMQRLVNEINHRVKNTLAVVQGICMHSLRGAQSLEGFADSFTGSRAPPGGRRRRLAAAQGGDRAGHGAPGACGQCARARRLVGPGRQGPAHLAHRSCRRGRWSRI